MADAWFDFGSFCLRYAGSAGMAERRRFELVGKAAECLAEATAKDPLHVDATRLLACVLLEQWRWERSRGVLQKALDLESPALAPARESLEALRKALRQAHPPLAERTAAKVPTDGSGGGGSGGDSGSAPQGPPARSTADKAVELKAAEDALAAAAAEAEPLSNVLMCLQLSAVGDAVGARASLGHAVRGFRDVRGMSAPGKPRRTASLLGIEAAEYLVASGLAGLTKQALDLAAKAEAAALAKAAGYGKGGPFKGVKGKVARSAAATAAREAAARVEGSGEAGGAEPLAVKHRRLRCLARMHLHQNPKAALALAQESTELGAFEDQEEISAEDKELAWMVRGDCHHTLGERGPAAESFAEAVKSMTERGAVVPLRTLVRLGNLRLSLGQYEEAKQVFLGGAGGW